jgi:hypothetical protein
MLPENVAVEDLHRQKLHADPLTAVGRGGKFVVANSLKSGV